jgi:hypothetical protein
MQYYAGIDVSLLPADSRRDFFALDGGSAAYSGVPTTRVCSRCGEGRTGAFSGRLHLETSKTGAGAVLKTSLGALGFQRLEPLLQSTPQSVTSSGSWTPTRSNRCPAPCRHPSRESTPEGQRHIAVDGKALRLSFDNFWDRKAAHILSAFASDPALVLAHLDCDEKSNEIPAVQALLRQLGLEQALPTGDAMHCQKNI